MYWTRKMHKGPICARFIVASKKSGKKIILKAVSKAFILIFDQIQNL